MIFDTLDNAEKYEGLCPNIMAILKEAKKYDAKNFPSEVMVLNDKAKMINASYETHPFEGAKAEAHRQFVDVMVMIDGEEMIYVKPTGRLSNITMEYDVSQDALLADTDADMTAVYMKPGCFCILYPQDAHAPGCIAGEKMNIKKFIGKVRIDGWCPIA